MIIEDIKGIVSDKKSLRSFGLVMGTALIILFGIIFWKADKLNYYLLYAAGAFYALGLIVPIVLWPLHKVWMTIAVVLGFFVSRIILSVLFYLMISPLGLLLRLFGKDFLDLKFRKDTDSYWNDRKQPADLKKYFRDQY